MKLSLKLPDQQDANPLVTAKIPVSIFNHPFLTSVSTASPSSDLSFSLSSNLPSGPSLKLSYSPTLSPSLSPPFSLSLKSGLGPFGSPTQSPLVFKAHFSFSSPNPTFSLLFKPRFGHFSLTKASLSNPGGATAVPGTIPGSESGSNGGEAVDGGSVWQELNLEPCGGHGSGSVDGNCAGSLGSKGAENGGVFSGIAVLARTSLPLGKRLTLDMRWGVNLPAKSASKLPRLTMNKILIERAKEKEAGNESGESGDLGLLKGLCLRMSRDLEALERENRDMKRGLEEMARLRVGAPNAQLPRLSVQPGSGPRVTPSGSTVEFEKWKSKKRTVTDENLRREPKKPSSPASDLESELQRAIAEAAGSSV